MGSTKNVEIKNIPILNLKKEFLQHNDLIHSEAFKKAAFNSAVKPLQLQLPPMLWNGMPDELFTLMTQRAIGGLESYVVAAVEYELLKAGRLTDDTKNILSDPFKLGGGAVTVLYNKVPELLSKDAMLSNTSPDLDEKTKKLYKEIRNPIFHGNQLVCSYENYHVLMDAYSHMRLLYSWIDEWYSAFPNDEARY